MQNRRVSKSLQNLNNVNKCLLFKTIEHAQAKLLKDYTLSFKETSTFYLVHHPPFITFTSHTSLAILPTKFPASPRSIKHKGTTHHCSCHTLLNFPTQLHYILSIVKQKNSWPLKSKRGHHQLPLLLSFPYFDILFFSIRSSSNKYFHLNFPSSYIFNSSLLDLNVSSQLTSATIQGDTTAGPSLEVPVPYSFLPHIRHFYPLSSFFTLSYSST
jgi:hypothetical protein